MGEQAVIAAEVRTGYRPVYIWPPLEDVELVAFKEAMPDLLPYDIEADAVNALKHRYGEEGAHSEILIPRTFFGIEPEGPQQLRWNNMIASVLSYRELRYGRQDVTPAYKSRYFIGLREPLSREESRLCYDRRVTQFQDGQERQPEEFLANPDGSQTYEYASNISMKGSDRLDRLLLLIVRKLGPAIGRLVASNVEIELTEGIEQPSLFSDYHNPGNH